MKVAETVLDYGRSSRIGFDEAVLCESKSAEQLVAILSDADKKDHPLLLTRLSKAKLQQLGRTWHGRLDYDAVSKTAYFGTRIQPSSNLERMAVVTAGTSDVPVGREAIRTLKYFGEDVLEIYDVGVAGLWRLLDRVEELRRLPVVIVAAGMDGALPSVICGLIPGIVIALPTSVGYGVCDGGRTALYSALASCAPGLVTVNIDNGYGAAAAALRVLAAGRIYLEE
ncbi:nickel pincer cofactor biosynthesis protein LarB [Pseudorhodoplanes sp.]|uniref:nickel pincer cofactor biosynthesis protein LarB n=1 Tax=Pseudorhodoplanes sp. TaxID=1934341 RepID=UPI003D139495